MNYKWRPLACAVHQSSFIVSFCPRITRMDANKHCRVHEMHQGDGCGVFHAPYVELSPRNKTQISKEYHAKTEEQLRNKHGTRRNKTEQIRPPHTTSRAWPNCNHKMLWFTGQKKRIALRPGCHVHAFRGHAFADGSRKGAKDGANPSSPRRRGPSGTQVRTALDSRLRGNDEVDASCSC